VTSTWDDGPWIVDVRVRYRIGGCGTETAKRAAVSSLRHYKEMPNAESWPPVLDELEMRIEVFPESLEPFDVDDLRKE
jgi:hypothetical protein